MTTVAMGREPDSVPCPACGAPEGKPCQRGDRALRRFHYQRMRLARGAAAARRAAFETNYLSSINPAAARPPPVGVDLRDHFAGQVMAQLADEEYDSLGEWVGDVAYRAYLLADAMLHERNKSR